jgi:fused signal recognition particle receptor
MRSPLYYQKLTQESTQFVIPHKRNLCSNGGGVNGVGKTTTIGKLAYQFKKAGYNFLGAADTFRAAIDQLQIWADRVGVPIVRQEMGDPASVFVQSAVAQNADGVMIPQVVYKINLMNELTKVKRVMQK